MRRRKEGEKEGGRKKRGFFKNTQLGWSPHVSGQVQLAAKKQLYLPSPAVCYTCFGAIKISGLYGEPLYKLLVLCNLQSNVKVSKWH
jgi:hypothetical protein